jgi:stearoyl-CoA desaturase (delta-9 desaturase)
MLMAILVAVLAGLASMQLSSFCTTIYLHRAMAHKGLRLHPAVAMLMRIEIWLFTGISMREWVAVHRKHHHFTDEEGDPHSPHLMGLTRVLLWNAVYYAREAKKPEVIEKYTRDIGSSPADFLLDRGLIGLGIMMAVFVAGFHLLVPGWAGAVIGAVTFVAQGAAYIFGSAVINSICHVIGYKNFENTATNLRSVAFWTGGEGLHNNHHQYPASSRFSMRRGEFDPAWPVIRMLERFRLAEALPLPEEHAA